MLLRFELLWPLPMHGILLLRKDGIGINVRLHDAGQ